MHGAAQTANAPPSRNDEPRRRAPWTSPAPTSLFGSGSRPMNPSPKTIRMKPAICSSRIWLRWNERPTAAAPAPSRTNTVISPATNGTLASEDAAGGAGLPEPVGLDATRPPRGSPGRAAARTARGTRRSPRRTRPAAGRRAHGRSVRARRRAGARARDPAAARRRRLARARRLQRQASSADDDRPECEPGERQQPGEQVEARASAAPRARPWPNCSTSSALISLFVSPAAIRSRMICLHAQRDRRVRGVERRLADRAHELGLELGGVGRSSLAAAGAARRARARPSATSRLIDGGASARSTPSSSSSASRTAPAMRWTTRAARVDEVRLREAGDAVAPDRRALPVVDGRVGDAEPAHERLARRRGSPSRRRRRRRRPCPASAASRASSSGVSSLHGPHHDAQKLTTTALPRSDASESSPSPSSRGSENAGASASAAVERLR